MVRFHHLPMINTLWVVMRIVILLISIFLPACSVGRSELSRQRFRPVMNYQVSEVDSKKGIVAYRIPASRLKLLLTIMYPEATIIITDENYSIVDQKWLCNEFSRYFRLVVKGLEKTDAVFDCDDWVRIILQELQMCHLKSQHVTQGVLVGEIHYIDSIKDEVVTKHASCMTVSISEDDKVILMFFEPQTGSFVKLTSEQIASIYYIRF